MDQPRLAILAPLKAWGGIEGNFLTLTSELLAQGVNIDILLARGGQTPYPDQLDSRVKIVDLETRSKLHTIFKLAEFLKRDPPNAILTAKDHSAKAAIATKIILKSEVPVFVQLNNTQSEVLRRPFRKKLAQILYPKADHLITVSEGVREDFLKFFNVSPHQVTTIYNPVILPDFQARADQPVDHPWLKRAGPPVVMAMGRLTPQKDFTTLLEAFARLREQRAVRLIILGEGPLREELERKVLELGIRESVDLPGFVPDPLPWLARANLFVLSSRYEGLGNVLIEALAAGTPAVATDCPSGPREILEGGRLGELVPVGDPEALARAMKRTLAEPSPLDGLEETLDRFRSEAVARRYLEVMGLV